VVVAEPEPAPEPVPEPEPEPAQLADNVDPILQLVAGGPEPDENLLKDASFFFYAIAADGTVAADTSVTIYSDGKGALPPGKYQMQTTLHDAVVTQEVEIGAATDLSQPVAVLDAGVLNLTMRPAPGAEPDIDAYWEMRGPDDVGESSYGRATHVFPAGEYSFLARLGAAETSQSVVIEAGKVTELDLVIGVGLAVVEAFYTEAMMVDGAEHFVEILAAQKDMDGNRASISYTYGAGASFDLPAGDYVAVVTLGAAKAETPFTVKVGERVDITVPLNAGVAAFTIPGDQFIEVFAAKPDINGKRASFGYSYGPTWQTTLPAGDYVVVVTKDDKTAETPLAVVAGERSELAPTVP
jgi:Ca-activated chloride channel homolog